jgi:pyruvate-formate lyase
MLMLMRFSIYINLLRDIASDNKLKYISFYTNLLKGVKIDKNKRLSKGSFKFLKTLFNIRSLFKRSSFLAILYIN